MNTFLLTEDTFERLRPRLAGLAGKVRFMTMGRDRVLRADGIEIPREEARPDCGLVSNDLFVSEHGPDYFRLLAELESLRWVHSVGAGYDHPVFNALAQRGTVLTNNHSQAVGMADYVLWGVLDHFQNGRLRDADQAAHRWQRHEAREVAGTSWLIIGFGAIGQGVARRARAFGAHVTGVRRNPATSLDADALITPERVPEHLGAADVVVCCVPQTPATLNMVDAGFLTAMKPGSVLVNVGRGSLVDELALLAALDAGKPEHAVLDVFRTEPLPADSPFWDHPRVTVTPHNSAASAGMFERTDALTVENIERYAEGRELLNPVAASDVLEAATRR